MKTNQLINLLARDAEAVDRPRWGGRMALTVLAGLAIAALLVAISIGVRPDIGVAYAAVLMKAAFSAAAAAAMLPLALRLMKPGRPLGWRIVAVAAFVAIAALATLVALLGEAPEGRLAAWLGVHGVPWCLVFIPILAAPTAAGLVWLMRSFAPTRLALAGAAIGAFSGGIGAMAYSMYCPTDSVAFVTTWYVLAIGICAAIGALVGTRLMRW